MAAFRFGDDLDAYWAFARREPPLEHDEELELIRRFRDAGDAAAGQRLVRASLRAVLAIAFRYRRYGVPTAELVAEGNFGLVRALGKFDPTHGTRFMTYASHWVRAYVIDYVIRSFSLVGGGSGALRSRYFFKLRRERSRITNVLGESEEVEALLAQRMGVGQARVSAMLRRLETRDVSLDVTPASGAGTLVEQLVADENQEQALGHRQVLELLHGTIAKAVGDLDVRERYIVEHRLMADREDELSLAEIGRKLGVSRERARQLEERAKHKLRKRIGSEPAAAALG